MIPAEVQPTTTLSLNKRRKMIIVGIDPGKLGSVARLDTAAGQFVVSNTPTTASEYDLPAMFRVLQTSSADLVILERAQAMPGQGVCSMFEFGRGYGLWQMALAASLLRTITVHPRVWTKVMLFGSHGEGKELIFVWWSPSNGLAGKGYPARALVALSLQRN
jgi:hypothetical protein